VATVLAAEMSGLACIPLRTEAFKLAIPHAFISHPQIVRLLDFFIHELSALSASGVAGYGFEPLGRMETA
jgi:molybdate-binding protein